MTAGVLEEIRNEASLFLTIRVYFSNIIEDVINRKALLTVTPNKEGHLEFKAEILDEAGKTTSADLGHTYRRLLCIPFDMACCVVTLARHFHGSCSMMVCLRC